MIKVDFVTAVKAMKEGKKVKRQAWGDMQKGIEGLDAPCWVKGGEYYKLTHDAFLATDWEIVEEKKTLSDKFQVVSDVLQVIADSKFEYKISSPIYKAEDVKEALKEFIGDLHNSKQADGTIHINYIQSKIIEIFGEGLI